MRVLTWNINGVRTLPQYHPWNTLKTFDDILIYLEADILCFQEMKSSRQMLPKQVALPPSFDSFFSFPTRKTGYSGTAVYTRKSVVVPLKAEEGLSGLVQPRPPLNEAERVSKYGTYPPELPEDDDHELDYKDLDSEGRAVVVDFGLFVLIGVYCPNDGTGSEERARFKMDYHRLLEKRVRALIAEGREVMVVGDLNACAAIEDHCEGRLMVERGLAQGLQGEEGFWGKEYRQWLRDWILKDDGTGTMVDIVRKFWPDRQDMYTCWNTKISARDTNYGTRIDFILITPGLVPWVKAADIQPSLKGSDHCPVYVDFHDEITDGDGTVTKLSDVLGARPAGSSPPEPPRLAAKFWDEHKQKLLSNFFGKKSGNDSQDKLSSTPLPASENPANTTPQSSEEENAHLPSAPAAIDLTTEPHTLSDSATPTLAIDRTPSVNDEPTPATKRKLVPNDSKFATKKPKLTKPQKTASQEKVTKSGQSTLAGFFAKPKTSRADDTAAVPSSSKSKAKSKSRQSSSPEPRGMESADHDVEDPDYLFALQLSQSEDNIMPFSSSQGSSGETSDQTTKQNKQKWNSLLAPTKAPNCTAHNEPAKEFTVNKPGPNKGKKFFVCARPVGPGYDKGRAERLRQHVDPQYKCDFFMWASDARKEMAKDQPEPM